MLAHSLAFTWLLWRRQHWAILGNIGYLLVFAVGSAYCNVPWAAEMMVGLAVIGLCRPAFFVLTVFTFGLEGSDLLARDSCFPASLFRLPVRTGSLVVWPLAVGAAAVVVVWLVSAWLIFRPCVAVLDGGTVPLWWPALFATAALAWFQALLWFPFGLRWLRVFLLTALIAGLIAACVCSARSGISEGLLVTAFAGLTLAAWVLGYLGVRHGRRGDVPNWELTLWPFRKLVQSWPQRRILFLSAAQAQVWNEWRRGGNSLPFMTGLVLPFGLWPLGFGKNDAISTEQTLLSALAFPVLLAGMFGMRSGITGGIKHHIGFGSFIATLPMSTADMVGAMLRVAARSTVVTWAIMRTGNVVGRGVNRKPSGSRRRPVATNDGRATADAPCRCDRGLCNLGARLDMETTGG